VNEDPESLRAPHAWPAAFAWTATSTRWQLPSGAFTNARWNGQDMHVPYSVATGTQGMSFCALYAITGEEKDLRIAEHAVQFLLENWQSDGRPIHHHHAVDQASPVNVTGFGDILYRRGETAGMWDNRYCRR